MSVTLSSVEMFAEELLNDENSLNRDSCGESSHVFDLSYEVVPRDVAHDRNDMPRSAVKIETLVMNATSSNARN